MSPFSHHLNIALVLENQDMKLSINTFLKALSLNSSISVVWQRSSAIIKQGKI